MPFIINESKIMKKLLEFCRQRSIAVRPLFVCAYSLMSSTSITKQTQKQYVAM